MDLEFMKWLSGLGVGGIIAAIIFNAYRQDMTNFTQQWKGQTELLVQVVKENTAAHAQNSAVVQSLHAHISQGDRRFERKAFDE